ncbi:MAG TPA: hypothetical protein DEA08_16995 [Planctomycetes bacterium]|nr:hypothetical protein [Planctomycetota bacterium]|tara:strand:+ start:286 stop:501 length:216 start_codon:yes stop_codon:yes gene_type:complete
MLNVVRVLAKPWVVAGVGSVTAYVLYKKNKDTGQRLREAKLELIEQQRTIDRLRAELGRERHRRIEGGASY